jgi:hypothetical protein
MWLLVCRIRPDQRMGQHLVPNGSYHIISYHIISYHIISYAHEFWMVKHLYEEGRGIFKIVFQILPSG